GSARYGPTDRSTSPSVHSKQQQWTRLCCLSREGPVGREGGGGREEGIDSLLVGGERESRRKKGVWGPLSAGEREGGGVGPRRGVSFRFATPLSR
ncbi:unnamed protein product, partial [Musa hybrid cultivar]